MQWMRATMPRSNLVSPAGHAPGTGLAAQAMAGVPVTHATAALGSVPGPPPSNPLLSCPPQVLLNLLPSVYLDVKKANQKVRRWWRGGAVQCGAAQGIGMGQPPAQRSRRPNPPPTRSAVGGAGGEERVGLVHLRL